MDVTEYKYPYGAILMGNDIDEFLAICQDFVTQTFPPVAVCMADQNFTHQTFPGPIFVKIFHFSTIQYCKE